MYHTGPSYMMWRLAVSSLIAFTCQPAVATSHLLQQAPLQEPAHNVSHGHRLTVNELLEFHKNLTEIESISGNEKHVGEWLSHSLKSQGYHVERQYVDNEEKRFNVYAYPGKKRDTELLVTSHIDTVPPFYPYTHNTTSIHGRGSVDDKASVAAQLIAVNNLLTANTLHPDDVALLFVVGEETGGDGMRQANALNLTPRAVIFGEPTEGKLVSGHKGHLSLVVHAHGKSAHSGYPWLGRSANEVLTRALAALMDLGPHLPRSDKYGITTFNLGKIVGGVAANVVAESATADIAVRIAEGTPVEIQAEIARVVGVAVEPFLSDEVKVEDVVTLEYWDEGYAPVDLDHDVPGFEVMTVNYGTDVPNLEDTVGGQKRYLYGPGSIMVAHSDHEALTEEELFGAVGGYERILRFAIGKGDEV